MKDIASTQELCVRGLEAWYGEAHVLHGIDLDVKQGETVTLLGRNGAGKTTTLRALMGLVDRRRGSVAFEGIETIGLPSRRIARLGLGYVPENRGIFARLSVRENLMLPPVIRPGGMAVDEIFALFGNLRERLDAPGTKLSGGEQQMLAMARILRTGCRVLLLDEPTEGLAPVIVQAIGVMLRRLRELDYTIVLVEQNLAFATGLCDRLYVMEEGRIVDRFDGEQVGQNTGKIAAYLGV